MSLRPLYPDEIEYYALPDGSLFGTFGSFTAHGSDRTTIARVLTEKLHGMISDLLLAYEVTNG